jgi:quercetin dioxygenase-like cupin family protein
VQEAQIETTPEGQVPADSGWFILNLGEMAWETVPGFGTWRDFEAPDADPSQRGIGVHVHVLQPGEANGYYHAEAAQEGFLVLSGECIAIVEGRERRMRRWDYLHSPPGTEHITVGAGDEPCAILMFGSPIQAARSNGSPTRPRRSTARASRRRPAGRRRCIGMCRRR